MCRDCLRLALCTLSIVGVLLVGNVGAQHATDLETLPTSLILVGLHDPVYPQLARMAAVQGDVELTLYVRPDGTVESVRMFSGHPYWGRRRLKAPRHHTSSVWAATMACGHTHLDTNFGSL